MGVDGMKTDYYTADKDMDGSDASALQTLLTWPKRIMACLYRHFEIYYNVALVADIIAGLLLIAFMNSGSIALSIVCVIAVVISAMLFLMPYM